MSCFPCYCRNVFAPVRTFGKREFFLSPLPPPLLSPSVQFVHLSQERAERAGKLCFDTGGNLIYTRARVPFFPPLRFPFASREIHGILLFFVESEILL